MPFLQIISFAGRLLDSANTFITEELKSAGIPDISPCHGDLFMVLFHDEGITVTALANRTHRSKSTVSVLVDKLEQNGYLEKRRDPTDARVIGLWLTPAGKALEPVFEQISVNLNNVLTKNMSATEASSLEMLLKRAFHNF